MARYAYVAVDRDGRERTGSLSAPDEAGARAQIEKKQWMPVRVAAAPAGAERSGQDQARADAAPLRGGKLSHRTLVLVMRQLSTLIDAAVPVDEALRLIAEQQEQASARRIVADVQQGVLEGQRLADALGRQPKSFPPLIRAAISGGERSGNLGPVVGRLADYLARAQALRMKITTALIYPTALTVVALSVVACLMIVVVPTLTEQFATFDAKLPLITEIMIAVSGFLSTFWPLLAVAAVAAVVVARAALRQPAIALSFDTALTAAPGLGRWIKVVNATRFARAVATLTASGLPVLDSVRAARESTSNRLIAKRFDAMAVRIEEGEPLSHAMRASGVFPALVTYMAASGESAGALPTMLEKAADHLDQDFEAFSTAAISLFEPAVIVVMGLVVASIVLAIMLPILQLNQLAIG